MKLPVFASAAVLMMISHVAMAEPPSVDAVKAAASDFRDNVLDDTKPVDKAQLAKFAAPFWYDGNTYISADDMANKMCKKSFGAKGTVKDAAKLEAYVSCFRQSMFAGALDGEATWTEANLKKLPPAFKKHASKLKGLAKDHRIVISHFTPAGPADYWALYAARDNGGKVVFDAWLVVNYTED